MIAGTFPGLVLAAAKKYPKAPVEFQAEIGWIALLAALCLLGWLWTRRDSLRRGLLGLEDPRIYAILRIGAALMTIQCFWNLHPYAEFLWSDEGIFTLEEARVRLGRQPLSGWGGDEVGFFNAWGAARFAWGKPSLLFIEGSPTFVQAYLWIFYGLLVLYALGVRTRITGVVVLVMMNGIYNRNALYLEGTDTVYRCLWFILVLAPTSRAWSFDNWLRVRRERQAMRGEAKAAWWHFADRGLHIAWLGLWLLIFCALTGWQVKAWLGGAMGVAMAIALGMAIAERVAPTPRREVVRYRLVGRWARVLLMLQLSAIYVTTGAWKTGSVWANGDALYYAQNMDHFYRFEGLTQQISAVFGTNLFRVATWTVLWWERLFPLVLLGMLLKFGLDHRNRDWYREQASRRRNLWVGRAALLAAYLLVWRVVVLAFPFAQELGKKGQPQSSDAGLLGVNLLFGLALPLLVVAWLALGRWPLRIIKPGATIRGRSLPELTVDQGFVRRWILGRRIWLTLGVVFHGWLVLFINIGMFPLIMLLCYLSFTSARPWLELVRGGFPEFAAADGPFGDAQSAESAAKEPAPWYLDPWAWVMGPWTLVRVLVRRGPRSAIAELAELDDRRAASDPVVPGVLILVLALGPLALIVLRALAVDAFPRGFESWSEASWLEALPDKDQLPRWAWRWLYGTWICCALVALIRRGRTLGAGGGPAPMRGSLTRGLALTVFTVHVLAVGTHLFPKYPILSFHEPTRKVFSNWIAGTDTTQSWKMFSPNPPRSNSFMKTVVITAEGERWDLRNNAFDERPNPWIFNDRMRKMQRRMVGKGKWYLRYWAQYQCRQWALSHGELPEEIEISKLVTKIPPPDKTVLRPYDPRRLKVTNPHIETHACDPRGQLTPAMKRRRGMALSEEELEKERKALEKAQRQVDVRRRSWERRRDFGGRSAKERAQGRAEAKMHAPSDAAQGLTGGDDEGVD